jgi:hypothetical protein
MIAHGEKGCQENGLWGWLDIFNGSGKGITTRLEKICPIGLGQSLRFKQERLEFFVILFG